MTTRALERAADLLFGCHGRDRSPEVVLLTRVVAITWILTGHALLLPTRSVPFFEWLAPVAASPLLAWAELVVGGVAAVQLALGRSVRASALTLGLSIFATTLLSRAFFSNNRLYVACVLVMVALEPDTRRPMLLRAQVGLMYLAAGLDKLLDTDWRSGVFLESFGRELGAYGRLWSPGAAAGTPYAPAELVAAVLERAPVAALVASWTVILVETGLGLGFLLGRTRLAVTLGVLFHTALLVATASPMGMYFYAALAAFLGFVHLPERTAVHVPRRFARAASRAGRLLDPDGRFALVEGASFGVEARQHRYQGLSGVAALLTSAPAFYVVLATLLASPAFSPWLAALGLVPCAVRLLAPPEQRSEVIEVAG